MRLKQAFDKYDEFEMIKSRFHVNKYYKQIQSKNTSSLAQFSERYSCKTFGLWIKKRSENNNVKKRSENKKKHFLSFRKKRIGNGTQQIL